MRHTRNTSFYTYILCILLIGYSAFVFYPKWNNNDGESSLGWDASTYYWYLPATFIYKDLKQQKFGDSIINKYHFTPDFCQSFVHSSGNRVITYSSGVALVQLPAFLIAHIVAKPFGFEADGFSKPYQVAVQMWCLLISIFGLWIFRKLLLLRFSDAVTSILLIMLVFGTNYLNYAAIDITITHSILFTIYALLLLTIHKYYAKPNRRTAIYIGLLCGLAILVRPSEMIVLLLPLLWGIESISATAFKKQFSFLKAQWVDIIVVAFMVMLIGSIQIGYWWYVTGSPVVYSYDDKTFSWLSPHTWKYLTSSTSGWLRYNPIVLFVFIGIPFFVKYGKNKVAILTFFILNLYIISAWDIWWYSGIGGRAMVQSYTISLLIAGTLIDSILKRRKATLIAVPFFLLFIYVNIWVHYHAHRATNLYDSIHMSNSYYWSVIGRWKTDKEKIKLQDARDIYTGKLVDSVLIYDNDFEQSGGSTEPPINGSKSLLVTGRSNSELFVIENIPKRKWIRLQCTYRGYELEWDNWAMFRTRIHFKKDGKEIKGEDYKPQRFLWNYGQRTIHYDTKTPNTAFDKIEISFLNENSSKNVMVDDIKVWAYDDE